MKFIVDCMCGKLAKWLKILGFDTLFFSAISDDDLIARAQEEKRILLTRDSGLLERVEPGQSLYIESEDWRRQLHQVLDAFDLRDKARPYSRCLECNRVLKDLPKPEAKNLVAAFIYETSEFFAVCPGCGRVFWHGTHHQDMSRKIEDILKKA